MKFGNSINNNFLLGNVVFRLIDSWLLFVPEKSKKIRE